MAQPPPQESVDYPLSLPWGQRPLRSPSQPGGGLSLHSMELLLCPQGETCLPQGLRPPNQQSSRVGSKRQVGIRCGHGEDCCPQLLDL